MRNIEHSKMFFALFLDEKSYPVNDKIPLYCIYSSKVAENGEMIISLFWVCHYINSKKRWSST